MQWTGTLLLPTAIGSPSVICRSYPCFWISSAACAPSQGALLSAAWMDTPHQAMAHGCDAVLWLLLLLEREGKGKRGHHILWRRRRSMK